jgi:hypothetical protein
VQEETDVESLPAPEIVSEPHESSVRTEQTAAIWERYEGLLARTNEEKKKGCNRGNAVIFSSENVWEIVKGPYEKGESAVRIIQPSVSSQTGRPSVTI